ncbi:MAG: CHAD domain-containing protein, partial [Acidimicrobiales bacterium]|nr:CHAD domain-containing protein [Acidimicrobiales bacterium]
HATLSRQLRSGRYQGLTMAWRAWLGAPVDQAQQAKRSTDPLGQAVARRLLEAQDRLLARGRAIDASTAAEELHELRKDAKRLRYLLECFGGLLPAAVRKPFVQRLKALQDNLGEHQDTEVHSAYLTALSLELQGRPEVTAQTLLAMGRLIELFERRRQAAREDFAERFAAYDAKPTARALNELIDAAGTP